MSNEMPPFDDGTAGPGQVHLSMDEIADLDEGLLAAERTSAALAHLQHCDECSRQADALAATTVALRALPPIPIPRDVADRIEAALAAESGAPASPGLRAVPTTSSGPVTSATVVPDLGEVRRRRFGRPTAAASAAAAVIILAVTAVVVGHSGGHHHPLEAAGSATEPLGGQSATSQSMRTVSSGRTYTASNLAALVPGLVDQQSPSSLREGALPAPTTTASAGVGSAGTATGGGSAAGGTLGTASQPPAGKTTNHSPAQTSGAPALAPPDALAAPQFNAAIPRTLDRYDSSAAALINCAQTWAPTVGAVPEVVDFGRWTDRSASPPIRHEPALILLYADPTNAASVVVVVVSASCDSSSLLTRAQVSVP